MSNYKHFRYINLRLEDIAGAIKIGMEYVRLSFMLFKKSFKFDNLL